MTSTPNLDQMTPDQLRAFAAQLLSQVDTMGKKIHRIETVNEQLTYEIAVLKRHKFAKRSEQLSPDQGSLLDDLLDIDIAAIEAELKAVNPSAAPAEPRQQPKRAPLPTQFPRTVIRHDPRARSAHVAASFSASAKTSARSSITRRACSRSSSTYVGSGPADSAKH
jgi:transposase